jgi:hypothetical protein
VPFERPPLYREGLRNPGGVLRRDAHLPCDLIGAGKIYAEDFCSAPAASPGSGLVKTRALGQSAFAFGEDSQYRRSGSNRHGALTPPDSESDSLGLPVSTAVERTAQSSRISAPSVALR